MGRVFIVTIAIGSVADPTSARGLDATRSAHALESRETGSAHATLDPGAMRSAHATLDPGAMRSAHATLDPGAIGGREVILHEPIVPNAEEDEAMHAIVEEGAAGDGPRPFIDASDLLASSPRSGPGDFPVGPFHPDRDTVRPTIDHYDDPFIPSVGPFKRVLAFDAVRDDYTLVVHEPRLAPIPTDSPAASTDRTFFCDLRIELNGSDPVRVPSVGPGARVVRARLSTGPREVAFRLLRDGADNWFVAPTDRAATGPARLVMTVVLEDSASTGPLNDNPWASLPAVSPLPRHVAREAIDVLATVGASRRMQPREAIGRLVQYFRSFTDSTTPTPARQSVYLDLALSKKGVCRHRAFAFLVTAQGLGIPTRLVMNEAHAWVEVHDGTSWHRIDLGGAGDLQDSAALTLDGLSSQPPADPFGWPDGSRRGGDMLVQARTRRGAVDATLPRPGATGATDSTLDAAESTFLHDASHITSPGAPVTTPDPMGTVSATKAEEDTLGTDSRPPSTIELRVLDADIHRGFPLRVRGSVSAGSAGCPYAAVELSMRNADTGRQARLGTVATDERGAFVGAIAVPQLLPAGDYDVVAHTAGTADCGQGSN